MLRTLIGAATLIGLAWLIATTPLLALGLTLTALTGVLLLVRWPWLIWLGIGALLPVTSGIKFGAASLTDLALAAAIALWFMDGVRRRTLRLHGSWVITVLLIYITSLYLSLLNAINLGEAAAEVVKWIEFALVCLIVHTVISAKQARWLVAALLLGAIGQGILGLYQFIYRIGPDWFIILGRFMRASGSFGQPNPYGGYLGLSLPVAVSLALWAWHSLLDQGGNRRNRLLWALFYTGATVLTAGGLLASWSRGGWLGAVVGVGLVIVLRSRQAAIVSGVVLLGLLCALLLGSFRPDMIPAPLADRVSDLPAYFGLTDVINQPVTDENFAVVERVAHWVAAVRMWESAPWLGVGPGNYATVYPDVRLLRWREPLGHAHNIYLNVLGEGGLVGLSAFLLLWSVITMWAWRRWRWAVQQGAGWHAALAVGVLGVIGHLSIHNFFDNLFVQGTYLHVALWLAVLSINSVPLNLHSSAESVQT